MSKLTKFVSYMRKCVMGGRVDGFRDGIFGSFSSFQWRTCCIGRHALLKDPSVFFTITRNFQLSARFSGSWSSQLSILDVPNIRFLVGVTEGVGMHLGAKNQNNCLKMPDFHHFSNWGKGTANNKPLPRCCHGFLILLGCWILFNSISSCTDYTNTWQEIQKHIALIFICSTF